MGASVLLLVFLLSTVYSYATYGEYSTALFDELNLVR